MEHDGIITDKVSMGAQFQSIDEVQNMIRHLQRLEEDMIKNNVHTNTNGSKGFSKSFEDLSVLEEKDYQIDDNETEWLTKVPGTKKISVKDLEADESFIDSGLLNVRFKLLNFIKSTIIEEKSSKFSNSPRCNNQNNMGTFSRRKSPPLSATISVSTASPPSLFHGTPPRSVISAFAATKSDNESSPISSVLAKNSFEFLSPSYQPPVSSNRLEAATNHHYFSTPSGKGIDSRTYTRPKKSRLPLETYDHLDLPVSPIRTVQQEFPLSLIEPLDIETTSATKNMNETFVAEEEEPPQKTQNDLSPPRRVTRNLSYVIRRDSESPNNNSPVNPSENNENIAVDLNNTYVRHSREDTYSPSPTGSSNSIHTSSMEELHNLARLQEQSLRMSSNPKMLTRKETHTVVRVPDQQNLRTMNKPTENQGQPKIRVQSRIPAPGAGSRIRPPVNGTRRPITSGGIRRAPEEWGGGAY